MKNALLVINPGSSSLRVSLFERGHHTVIAQQVFESAFANLSDEERTHVQDEHCAKIVRWILDIACHVDAVVYRVVHGGWSLYEPTEMRQEVLDAIEQAAPFAPLHTALSLKYAALFQHQYPHAKHIAVFDTAFHKTIPLVAARYALPAALTEKYHIRRYGFHGLAHAYAAQVVQETASAEKQLRHVHCHLGSGASVCAILDGRSVDCSMGFTPLEGLMMGTRSGDIDPGLAIYIQDQEKLSPQQFSTMISKSSGLLGVSGISADMKTLLAAYETHEQARLAVDMFCYRVVKYIGSFATILGGLDVVSWSGGIGEHAPKVRGNIYAQVQKSFPKALSTVIPVDEALHMAKAAAHLV
jgi:acetate kinase